MRLLLDYEGSPLAVMEYMAMGKPVVATRVGGVPDLVEDGVNGLLVGPRDPVALAEAVAELLVDPCGGRRWESEADSDSAASSTSMPRCGDSATCTRRSCSRTGRTGDEPPGQPGSHQSLDAARRGAATRDLPPLRP